MKTDSFVRSLLLTAALVFAAQVARGTTYYWTNGANANLNWSSSLNWTPNGVPGSLDTVIFNSTNAATSPGLSSIGGGPSAIVFANFNNVVDAGVSGTISALSYSNVGTFYQNTYLTNGVVLNITNTGALVSGSDSLDFGTTTALTTLAGTNATLNITNTNAIFFVGLGSAGGGSPVATNDMSALQTLRVAVSRFMVGCAYASTTTQNRPGGVLYLAATNVIVAEYQTGSMETSDTVGTGAVLVGDTTSNGGGDDYLYLGQSNSIKADTICVARQKIGHGLIQFNPIYSGANPFVSIGGFTNSRATILSIGDGVVNTGTTTAAGLVDLSLGTVNAQVITLYVGRAGATGSGGGATSGALNIGSGSFNVNTAYVGYQPTANTAGKTGTGTINVEQSGGSLVVNTTLNIATSATAGDATGTLNITNGGAVLANTIAPGAGNSTITLFGGNLVLTNTAGSASAGLTTLNLSNATITVSAALGVAPIVATNVNADYSATDVTTINISALPNLTSFPAVITLIQSPNSLSLQNGSFSFVVGAMPAGYSGTIIQGGANNNLVQLQVNSGPQVPSVWTGADIAANHNTNWTDTANWSSASIPGPNTLAIFNSSSAQSASALASPGAGPGAIVTSRINNIANQNFTITSLNYTNVAGSYENTSIATGDTVGLSSGYLTVGSPTLDFGNTTGNVTVSGPSGALEATNVAGLLYVGLGTATASATPQATLDMSGLGMFVSSNFNFLTGVGGYSAGGYMLPQPSGLVYLAQTNVIYAASPQTDTSDTVPVALEVGDADTSVGLPSALYLGWSNAIHADYISTGRQLGSGGIFFNPSVVGADPTAYIRGYSAAAVANWAIGDGVVNTTSTLASAGTNDFTGGSVNALANNLYVGNNSAGVNASGVVAGTLNFNNGTINVNNLSVSYNAAASDGNVYDTATGAVNVGGAGLLVVNTNLNLAYVGGNQSFSGAPTAILNITNGGTVWANVILPGTNNGVSIVSLSSGTLIVSNTAGTSAAPLTSLDVTNSTLDLAVAYNPAEVYATTVNVGGATNLVNIISLPPFASYPVTVTLIQSPNSLTAFNFGLGTLPAGYAGNISEGNSGTAVVLTITSGPVSVRPFVVWSGADSATTTNWSDRLNWQYPGAPTPVDNVYFNNAGSQSGSPFNNVGGGPGGVANPSYIDSAVNQNFTVDSLTFTNIGNVNGLGGVYQNVWIDSGVSLTTSNFNVGSTSIDFGGTATEFVTIGGSGTLNVNNTAAALWIGLQSATENSVTSSSVVGTLDMSGLGTFTANVSTFSVGALNSTANYPAGVLYLAQTNAITATGGATGETAQNEQLSLLVGETGKGVTSESFMYLGQMNTFNVNTLGVGIAKETAVMQFNAGLSGTPVATFRAADGASPVSTWAVADGLAQTGSSTTPVGTIDFTLGSVNALVSTMYLGRTPNVSGGHPATGTLNMTAGVFSVASLYDGYQAYAQSDYGVGTINLAGPGTLTVPGSLYLAATTGSSGASITTGTLNIGGGSALIGELVSDPTGNSTINLAGGTLAISNNTGTLTTLSLSPSTSNNVSAVLQIDPNPALSVGTLNIDGLTTTTNLIDLIAMPAITSYPVELAVIKYANFNNAGSVVNIGLGTFPANVVPYRGYLTNDTVNSEIAVVVTSGPVTQPLTWDGAGGSTWNFTQVDWRPSSGPDTTYNDTDTLTFDDSLTSGHNTITIASGVMPGGMTLNNSATNTYTFTGPGAISGDTGLNVLSNGTVILDNSATNSFTGLVTITNGTLQIGHNDANGLITASVTNSAPGQLVFERSDNVTFAGLISGNGTVAQNNTNTLMLAGNNSNFTGGISVLQGTLQPGNGNALGASTTTVSAGATLDFNNQVVTSVALLVSGAGVGGNGALVNSGASLIYAISNVTLQGNTTFGGTNGGWEIRGASSAAPATLRASGAPVTITKVGTNAVSVAYCNASDTNLQNVVIEQGAFSVQFGSVPFGLTNGLITVWSNANLEFYDLTNAMVKNVLLLDGGLIHSRQDQDAIGGIIYLTNNAANTAPGTGIITNDPNVAGDSLIVQSVITGPGNLVKTGAGTCVFSNANTYAGSTTVAAGTLVLSNTGSFASSANVTIASGATIDATGRGDLTLTVASGQTLQGGGNILGTLNALAGSTVAPGSPSATGELTVSSNVILAGTSYFKINNVNGGTNDVLASQNSTITYGGALQVVNLSANAFASGQSFQLFSAQGYAGAFSSTTLPSLPAGLAWNTSGLAASGRISVASSASPSPTRFNVFKLSGTTLTLSGTNGVPNGQYVVLSSTNLAQAWTPIATNNFDASGNFTFTENYSSANTHVFYTIEQP